MSKQLFSVEVALTTGSTSLSSGLCGLYLIRLIVRQKHFPRISLLGPHLPPTVAVPRRPSKGDTVLRDSSASSISPLVNLPPQLCKKPCPVLALDVILYFLPSIFTSEGYLWLSLRFRRLRTTSTFYFSSSEPLFFHSEEHQVFIRYRLSSYLLSIT